MAHDESKQQQGQPKSNVKHNDHHSTNKWSFQTQQFRTKILNAMHSYGLKPKFLSNDYIALPTPSFYPSRNDYDKRDIPSDFSLVDKSEKLYKVGYFKGTSKIPYTCRTVSYTMRKFPFQFIKKQNEYASLTRNYIPEAWHEFVWYLVSRSQIHNQQVPKVGTIMYFKNPSQYQKYDTAVIVDGYQSNKDGSLSVAWIQSNIIASFWNYNCLSHTSRILIIKTIDTSIYNTDKIVTKAGRQWTGSAAVIELAPIKFSYPMTDGHKHCAAVAFVCGQALKQIRIEKENNKLVILDKLKDKIIFFQHSNNDTKSKDGVFDVLGSILFDFVKEIEKYDNKKHFDEINRNISGTSIEINGTSSQWNRFYKIFNNSNTNDTSLEIFDRKHTDSSGNVTVYGPGYVSVEIALKRGRVYFATDVTKKAMYSVQG